MCVLADSPCSDVRKVCLVLGALCCIWRGALLTHHVSVFSVKRCG